MKRSSFSVREKVARDLRTQPERGFVKITLPKLAKELKRNLGK